MVKIYIDPGHGGTDPGATGNGLLEKNVNLNLALRLRDILLNDYQGVEVRMSRTTDVTRTLAQRTNDANSWSADYYISIHCNAFNGTTRGYEDFIHSSLSPTSVTAQRRDIMHQEITRVNGLVNRGKKSANFHVLRETNMSAILTENGFIDNAQDAALMKSSDWLHAVAKGHADGVARIFNLTPVSRVFRVIVDGVQIGAFQEPQNISNAVLQALPTAGSIVIERT
ncbi:N-acetylmuramoyl-L-alanine amidase family protein [Alteribacter keqinensis]|uniref:N-acetylmuramoyl-L-alanine amidase n=1 Tax=Alteribacter keqinensis TaxID=2483800 RepID=A0A3M7TNS2_9BACI|nr:N-acetylmuramoyl-L-alanine amidase [Alteribacter keqinensis]RNA67102.1 N-acetylmuramoyl-L-alanine amidase [Alteribacter keqinensis]